MKTVLSKTIWLVLLSVAVTGCAQTRSPQVSADWPEVTGQSLAPQLQSIPIGEILTYKVSWWGVPVARVVVTTSAPTVEDPFAGTSTARIHFAAKTNKSMDLFYAVRAQMTSWVDLQTLQPKRFETTITRRWESHASSIVFADGAAEHQLPKDKVERVPVTAITQDGLSMLYYIRRIPLPLGQEIPLQVTANGKNWDVVGRVTRATHMKVGKWGKLPVVEGEAELAYPLPFFHGAKARVWFTADDDRIPVMGKISSRVGPVSILLVDRHISSESGSVSSK